MTSIYFFMMNIPVNQSWMTVGYSRCFFYVSWSIISASMVIKFGKNIKSIFSLRMFKNEIAYLCLLLLLLLLLVIGLSVYVILLYADEFYYYIWHSLIHRLTSYRCMLYFLYFLFFQFFLKILENFFKILKNLEIKNQNFRKFIA